MSKSSTSPPRRHWAVPEAISDPEHVFGIDEQIRELASKPRAPRLSEIWLSSDGAVLFGRQCLVRAIRSAELASAGNFQGNWIDDWKHTSAAADKAAKALNSVIVAIGPENGLPDQPRHLKPVLAQIRLHDNPDMDRVADIYALAEEDAAALLRAHEVLRGLAATGKERRNAIADSRTNPGDPDKRAFVEALCEGWVALTGQKPGSNPLPERNPFLRLAICAWTDANQAEEADFARALTAGLAALQRQDIDRIARYGPAWAQ